MGINLSAPQTISGFFTAAASFPLILLLLALTLG